MPWKFDSHTSSPRTSQSFHCQTSRSLFPGKPLKIASRTPPPYIRSNLHSRRDFPPTGVLRSCTNTTRTSLRRIASKSTSPEISVRTLFSCTFPDHRRKDDGEQGKRRFHHIDTRSLCLGKSRRRLFDYRAPSILFPKTMTRSSSRRRRAQKRRSKKKTSSTSSSCSSCRGAQKSFFKREAARRDYLCCSLCSTMIVFFCRERREKKSAVKKKGAKSSQITLKFFDTHLFWNWIRSSQQTPGNTKNHSFKTHT